MLWVNDGFHSQNDHNFYKKISSTSTCGVGSSSALLAKFYSQGDHNFYKKSNLDSRALRTRKQDYLVGSKIGSSAFDCIGKKYSVADLLKCARPFTIKVAMGRDVKRKLLLYPAYMESRLSTIGVDNYGLWINFNTIALGYAPISWAVIHCDGAAVYAVVVLLGYAFLVE